MQILMLNYHENFDDFELVIRQFISQQFDEIEARYEQKCFDALNLEQKEQYLSLITDELINKEALNVLQFA